MSSCIHVFSLVVTFVERVLRKGGEKRFIKDGVDRL